MMQNNYYLLRQLSKQLKQEIAGFKIAEIFSQAKNELIILLYNETKEISIKAYLDPSFCCLSFPVQFHRAKRNSVDLFRGIIDFEIVDVIQIDNDRSFYFQLNDGFKLLFKMHGNRSNLILFQGQRVLEIFNNKLKQDQHIEITNLSNDMKTDEKSFREKNGDVQTLIPTFGKYFNKYLEMHNYTSMSIEEKWDSFNDLLHYLNDPGFFIHVASNKLPALNLYRINEEDIAFKKPVESLNAFFNQYISAHMLERGKKGIRNKINNQIKKSESYIQKSSSKLKSLGSAANYKHIGDLIMANLHGIEPYSAEVSLIDFYTQQPVMIRLKPSLTPQLNAEKYYRKAKRQKIEIDVVNKNIEERKRQIDELKIQLSSLDQVTKIKNLNKSGKRNLEKPEAPYHLVEYMGYEILIGKNAVKNELLTFNIAKKEDIFLHAKDVPGSHVIIKKRSNQNVPITVVEKAASFAAYYSKSKSESLSRVLYTPKKYVRKAKGMAKGVVIVELEKVILVKPTKFTKS